MQIKIKRIENGKLPEYKTVGSAGADCYARIEKEIILNENDTVTIPLGFAVEIPDGYEMQIRPRSGLARKDKTVAVLGTIDSDYRGEGGFGSTGVSEKFYEPFKTVAEAEMYLGRKVIIDNKINAKVKAVWYNSENYIMIQFVDDEEKTYTMYLVTAFEKVKIDGHRFGREIKES